MADIDVKICGLTTVEGIEAAAGAGASHAGFVFFDPSPRNVRPREAPALVKYVPKSVKRVGVFVEPEDSLLERAIAAARLDIVQLHGDERPERLKSIKARLNVEIWKAIPVSTASDLERARRYRDHADMILFDARTPKASRLPGGMGIAFDWKLLNRLTHKMPWALSGGLSAENVAEAIAITGATMLDVSSGVESEPGKKDPAKISAFMEAVKAA
ncbi:phosphoribosylanthranilate isomerase [Parasphingopyxis sp. CP4]|uniref:phosphoribosylanthranilate isomerase n=1 Tax=Parasphingopyxis sp. CP4 TaxID=2724527 RepID=UPI0015A02915|nr:phosphoribosylanthranilate isomerase [Parasphingopyxis sp. CP4]QLC21382.1 phosphoribosylanthranilate isomerase [Parasphingopyxis sp. CP4]